MHFEGISRESREWGDPMNEELREEYQFDYRNAQLNRFWLAHTGTRIMPASVASPRTPELRQGLPHSFRRASTVYAIAFDMDIDQLRANYGDPYNNAYLEIRRLLQRHGFTWQQGSVYYGGPDITAVSCVLAAQDLARVLPWFAASVRDIRMLRIEELNDLMPAIQQAIGGPS